MKLITSAVIFSLSSTASASLFGPSVWDVEKQSIVEDYTLLLNQTIPFWTTAPFSLVERMYEDGILVADEFNTDAGVNALSRLLGYSTFFNEGLLTKKPTCRDDTFGFNGEYTDVVCDQVEAVSNICTSLEPGCDITKLPSVVSASSDQLLQTFTLDADGDEVPEGASDALDTKRTLMKTAVCIYRVLSGFGAPFNALTDCYDYDNLPDDADLGNRVANYFSAMIYVLSAEFNNPLWTNTAIATSKDIDPDSSFVLGDGYLKLAEETWDAFENKPTKTLNSDKTSFSQNHVVGNRDRTYAKTVVVDTLVQQYTDDEETSPTLSFVDDDEDQFYRDVLHGYFFQRYADELFPGRNEKKMLLDGTNIRSSTFCAIPIGALMAAKCGVHASDIHEYMTYYYANGLGSQDTYTGEDVCVDSALNTTKSCDAIGGSGRNSKCCTFDTTTSTCASAIGTDFCMTKFCRNFDRVDLWKAKRTITNPDAYDHSSPPTKLSKEACFNELALV